MISLVLDPFLLGSPLNCTSDIELESYVDGLLSWSAAARRADARLLFSEQTLNALLESGQFPMRSQMHALIERFQIEAFDVDTVCRVAEALWERQPFENNEVPATDVLVADAGTTIDPEIYSDRLPEIVAAALRDTLARVAACEGGYCETPSRFAFATTPQPADSAVIEVVTQLVALKCIGATETIEFATPEEIREALPICRGWPEALALTGPLQLWATAKTNQSIADAISAEVEALKRRLHRSSQARPFRIGTGFRDSLRAWTFDTRTDLASVLIESCARILLGIPKNECKEFRVQAGQHSDPRTRADGAVAYRTHLTKSNAGYRLMYWQLPEGLIEFANVGDKDELEIDLGRALNSRP